MNLPFTTAQFLEVFSRYNADIWPGQAVMYALGLVVLVVVWSRRKEAAPVIWSSLAVFWLWNGIAYHLLYFQSIDRAATLFGALFVVQAAAFFAMGRRRPVISFRTGKDVRSVCGACLAIYAMLIYPAIGYALGHRYPASPVFSVAPCPTVIFTLGVLLWTDKRLPRSLLIIPLLWTAAGSAAVITLGMREDLGLLAAGIIAGWILLLPAHRRGATRGGPLYGPVL